MATDVLMPQMGESVTEGTVTRWLKKVGDTVGRDEPLFEISTDKVDAEIPSPAAGVLAKVLVTEGQTAAVHSLVAVIEPAGTAVRTSAAPPMPIAAPKPSAAPSAAQAARPATTAPLARAAEPVSARPPATEDIRSSPLVRRIATENNVDLSQVAGTGLGGRISKEDVLAYIEARKGAPALARSAAVTRTAPAPAPAVTRAEEREPVRPAPLPSGPGREEVVPMSAMRKKISEHMVFSRHTSAHVTTVFAIDLTRVAGIYHREKEHFEQQESTRLGYTPFFIRAIIDGLKRFPILNSSLVGENVVYKKDVNMGIAVALDWGLIVPVIHQADEKSFLGLARAVNDLADRARRKKLAVEEVQGGTFTITNPGALGSLFATPIINQPQVGIIGVGSINKMPVVVNDAIAIRSIVHLSLSYDHRLIDGAVADQFMAAVKSYLENWEETLL